MLQPTTTQIENDMSNFNAVNFLVGVRGLAKSVNIGRAWRSASRGILAPVLWRVPSDPLHCHFTATRFHTLAQGWPRGGLPWVTQPMNGLTLKAIHKPMTQSSSQTREKKRGQTLEAVTTLPSSAASERLEILARPAESDR